MESIKNFFIGVFRWVGEHKKATLVIGIIGVVIALFVIADAYTERKELANAKGTDSEDAPQTEYDLEQQKLIEKWGEPKEGFRWTEDGALQAVGETDKTSEDVIFIYVRSLSTLDFANAQRYSYKTDTINTYARFYDKDADFSYNKDFQSSMYKQVLLSMEPIKIKNTATFANFKEVITLEINMLDLTNKDFWKSEQEELFQELKKYRVLERDTTKMKEFIYNYVLSYYTSKEAKTRTVSVDFTLEQTIDGAWLVTNDSALDAVAKYQDGELVVNDILTNFDDWITNQDGNELQSSTNGGSFGTGSNADELLDKDTGVYKPKEGSDEITEQRKEEIDYSKSDLMGQ